MSLFNIDDDVKAMRRRLEESLDKFDKVTAEAEGLLKDLRETLAAARAGLALPKP